MQGFGFSWAMRKPHSIPDEPISLSLHKLLTDVWAAGRSSVTTQDQDSTSAASCTVVCDRAVDENLGVGWHWGTWSSVKCDHNQTLLRCDPSSPFSDPEKTLLPQRATACGRCLPLPSLEGQQPLFPPGQGVQSIPHTSVVPSPAASADWQKCISLKYGTATETRDPKPLSKSHCSQTQGAEKAFWPESSETESSQTHFTITLSFCIFQACSRAWRLNYLFQARFTPHWAKEKPSKQRYKTSTWCFQGSLPGNRLISGRQMERCLSVFKCYGVQLSSSMFYAHMRRLDLDLSFTHIHTHARTRVLQPTSPLAFWFSGHFSGSGEVHSFTTRGNQTEIRGGSGRRKKVEFDIETFHPVGRI